MPRRLVLGRPVKFAGPNPDAALAQERYEAAFRRFGFEEIHHVMEPVAAAYFYAHKQKAASTVLVGDFGGGTSDFSIVRFEPTARGVHAYPISYSGVGIAGDTFDYRIIDRVVAPILGKGSQYRSFEKLLDMPASYYHNFARWSDLCLMRSSGAVAELKRLAGASLEAEKIEKFIALIEGNAAYTLYKAVSEAKTRLSHEDTARLLFSAAGVEVDAAITRADFERWIAKDLDSINSCIDDALHKAALEPHAIDRVFLTGGTSFVPAVRKIFADRFGAAKVDSGDEFVSIAYGLALIGEDEDIGRWTVKENPRGLRNPVRLLLTRVAARRSRNSSQFLRPPNKPVGVRRPDPAPASKPARHRAISAARSKACLVRWRRVWRPGGVPNARANVSGRSPGSAGEAVAV